MRRMEQIKKSNKNRPERTNIQQIIRFDDVVTRGRVRTVQRVKWGKLYTNVKTKQRETVFLLASGDENWEQKRQVCNKTDETFK